MPATPDFRLPFESTPSLYVILTTDFRIVAVSDFWLRANATTREDIIGRNIFDVLPDNPDDFEASGARSLRDSLEKVVRSGQADTMPIRKYNIGQPQPGRGGSEERYWGRTNAPVRRPGGEVAYIIHHVEDLTGLVRLQQEHQSLEGQLRQSQKMEAVGRLAGGVAHDFNNILTVITGFANMVLDRLPKGEVAEYVKEIDHAAMRAASLTRQLLTFSRKQILQPKVLDLNDVVRGMEELMRRLIGDNISLVTVLSGGTCKVMADRGQMEQVVMNLAVNARDAMPNGGRLVIETRNGPGPFAMLSVSDTGQGMDADTVSHIFEPFFTTKDIGKGTGLGLATVYGVVEQSGGTISVESKPAQGSIFRVSLPIAAETGEVSAIHPVEHLLSGTGTVLVVEDETPLRGLVCKVLNGAHYRVLQAANGHEALVAAAKYTKPIDLLIADVLMPGMSGPELMDKLCQSRPDLAVLFMSGYDRELLGQRETTRVVRFLPKPFTPQALLATVHDLLKDDGAYPVSA